MDGISEHRKNNSACFSGHRIEKLTCSREWLSNELGSCIEQSIEDGIHTFYHGCCTGVDLIAAELVLARRFIVKPGDPQHIKLISVIPFEGQATRWSEHWRERYFKVLENSDEVITLHTTFKQGCYLERNRYMVDKCSRLIAVYDGESSSGTGYTVQYAKKMGIQVQIIKV